MDNTVEAVREFDSGFLGSGESLHGRGAAEEYMPGARAPVFCARVSVRSPAGAKVIRDGGSFAPNGASFHICDSFAGACAPAYIPGAPPGRVTARRFAGCPQPVVAATRAKVAERLLSAPFAKFFTGLKRP